MTLEKSWKFFRLMAFIVGTALAVLTFVALPYEYLLGYGKNTWTSLAWMAHGYLFMVYVSASFVLAGKLKWPLVKTALVMIAGTVPLMSFVVERKIAKEVAARS